MLPRFDLGTAQIEKILEKPKAASVESSVSGIAENPYLLAEEYVGDTPDDQITLSQIDRGVLTSPELGGHWDLEPDDAERLRDFCVDQLKRSSQHTFLAAEDLLAGIRSRLASMPEWKRARFSIAEVRSESEFLEAALQLREDSDRLYLYRRAVFEDERYVEETLRSLVQRSDITLRQPVTQGHWEGFLTRSESELTRRHPAEYEAAVRAQAATCQQIFPNSVSVLSGGAGTGKTTVVRALISAVERAHGAGASFQLLAPTGKAEDRLREQTEKSARTIHSFLAGLGWLNDNFTLRRSGGRREEGVSTYVIDESSMIDLSLLAALFRAINWNSVQRLILVGDPNQLPPIGTGRVFADLLQWLKGQFPENVGRLDTNVRQLENTASGRGRAILDLASLFERSGVTDVKDGDRDSKEECVLAKAHEGGNVDQDLRVVFWNDADELGASLLATIVSDMESEIGSHLDPAAPYKLWDEFLRPGGGDADPERLQVISPDLTPRLVPRLISVTRC